MFITEIYRECEWQDKKLSDFFSINTNNVDNICFNCMGYAFNSVEWLELLNLNDSVESYMEELNIKVDNKKVYRSIARALDNSNYSNHYLRKVILKRLLTIFPDLRIVDSFNELENDEYGISFATGLDDYHFIKYEDGAYTDKQGESQIRSLSNEREGFGTIYHKIIRFAMKKGIPTCRDYYENI